MSLNKVDQYPALVFVPRWQQRSRNRVASLAGAAAGLIDYLSGEAQGPNPFPPLLPT